MRDAATQRFHMAMGAFAVLGALAGFTLDGKIRIAVPAWRRARPYTTTEPASTKTETVAGFKLKHVAG